MSKDRVTMTLTDHVADVRLNRPGKLNAIDGEMMDAIIEMGRVIAGDRTVRAVVLSGEGRGFSAGLDMANFADMASGDLDGSSESVTEAAADLSPTGAARPQMIGWAWYELPQPVIAAIHGPAFGAGLHVALGADVRYVAPDARLAFVETSWGLVPDLSAMQSLRRLARLDVIKELIMTSREFDGNEAVELGIATRCVENPYDTAMTVASAIAAKSPDAMRAAKALANRSAQVPMAEGLALELATSMGLMGSPNQIEAVLAGLEGRPPDFAD